MNSKSILIVGGEPNSVFLEIFFKVLESKKILNPLILITSENILKLQMKKLKYKKNIRLIKPKDITKYKLNNKSINLVNVEYNSVNAFEKISNKSNLFIKNSFKTAFQILKQNKIVKSTRGTQGGYVLSKKPNEIKLTNILNAVDEKVKTVQCKKESKKGCNGKATKCVTHNLWDELETHINTFFDKKSLQDLLKNNSERIN